MGNHKYNQISLPIYPNWDGTNRFIDFIKKLEQDIEGCFNKKNPKKEWNSLINKKNLLNLIEEMPVNKYQSIANKDWNISKQHERIYQNYFLNNILDPYLNLFIKRLKVSKCTLHNFWFQQYNKNDFHDWHTHAGANYTNVFYIELPNKNMTTEIKTLNNIFI
jgi:hypothetical protein